MSGIAGVYRLDGGVVEAAELAAMSAALAHRGTDAAGVWVDASIGLAHRLLATTRASLAVRHPAADTSGAVRLVWDGRLDNRDELEAGADESDEAVVLRGYARWGAEYVERVRAVFREAVAARLRTDWPVGALLSGGLDSSAIVCAAGRTWEERGEGSPPLQTFTLFADHPAGDEREPARVVTEATGLKGHAVRRLDADPLDGLDAEVDAAGGPIVDPSHHTMAGCLDAIGAAACSGSPARCARSPARTAPRRVRSGSTRQRCWRPPPSGTGASGCSGACRRAGWTPRWRAAYVCVDA